MQQENTWKNHTFNKRLLGTTTIALRDNLEEPTNTPINNLEEPQTQQEITLKNHTFKKSYLGRIADKTSKTVCKITETTKINTWKNYR